MFVFLKIQITLFKYIYNKTEPTQAEPGLPAATLRPAAGVLPTHAPDHTHPATDGPDRPTNQNSLPDPAAGSVRSYNSTFHVRRGGPTNERATAGVTRPKCPASLLVCTKTRFTIHFT